MIIILIRLSFGKSLGEVPGSEMSESSGLHLFKLFDTCCKRAFQKLAPIYIFINILTMCLVPHNSSTLGFIILFHLG